MYSFKCKYLKKFSETELIKEEMRFFPTFIRLLTIDYSIESFKLSKECDMNRPLVITLAFFFCLSTLFLTTKKSLLSSDTRKKCNRWFALKLDFFIIYFCRHSCIDFTQSILSFFFVNISLVFFRNSQFTYETALERVQHNNNTQLPP